MRRVMYRPSTVARRCTIVGVLGVTVASAGPLAAQPREVGVRRDPVLGPPHASARPAPGTYIRVTDHAGRRMEGRVWAATADSVQLGAAAPGFLTLAWSDVRSFQIAAGRDRGRGALRGALVGGALGVVLVGLAQQQDSKAQDAVVTARSVAVPGAILLAGLGAGIGAFAAPVRWGRDLIVQPTSIGSRSGTSVGAPVGMVRVGWSTHF